MVGTMQFIFILTILQQFAFMNLTKIHNVNFSVWSDERYNLLTYNMTRSNGDMIFNVLINQTVDLILRSNARLTVMVADGANDQDFNRLLSENTIDFCKASAVLKSSILVRSIITKLMECVEVNKIKCPYKRGTIRLTDCKVSSFSVPDIWRSDTNFKIFIKATAKLPTKKWVELWIAEIVGHYKGSRIN
ncbi:unnamed protein product [Diamesa serratosioi]